MDLRNYLTFALMGFCSSPFAHQPVMDMAPRWAEGYGFQVRHERYGSNKLLLDHSTVSNPLKLSRHVEKTWLEGVYTFKPSVRVTFKLPYIRQERVKRVGALANYQKSKGFGDLIVGLPLKHYRNKGAYTDNFGFTPSLRLPTGSSQGAFPLGDGSVDLGLSFSHSLETIKFYTLIDAFYWLNTKGRNGMHEGNELGMDVNLGYRPYHNNQTNTGVFIMWDVSARHNQTPNALTLTTASGGTRIHSGPVLVAYRDSVMFRAEYKLPFYEKVSGVSNSRGSEYSVAMGMTF